MLIDLIGRAKLPVEIFTLDTGLLFDETYALWGALEQRYGITIRAVRPVHTVEQQAAEHGAALWERDPDRFFQLEGHLARMETAEPIEGRRRFKGTLMGLEGGAVKMKLEDGKEAHVPLSIVTRAKLEITDALLAEHRRAQEGVEQPH